MIASRRIQRTKLVGREPPVATPNVQLSNRPTTQITIIQRCTYGVHQSIRRIAGRLLYSVRRAHYIRRSFFQQPQSFSLKLCCVRNLFDDRITSANTPTVNHRFLSNRSIKRHVELRIPNAETVTTRHESISSNNNSSRRRSDKSYSNAYTSGKMHGRRLAYAHTSVLLTQ